MRASAKAHAPAPSALLAFALVFSLCWVSSAAWADETDDRIRLLLRDAISYEHGEGVTKDVARAYALYCEAAKEGDAEAQYALGWMHANGRGVERDDDVAAIFFSLAAAQGHAHAQRALGYMGAGAGMLPKCMIDQSLAHIPPGMDFTALYALNPQKKRVVDLVRQLAPQYDVHPQLALAVIAVESNFDHRARSPKNAQGLMQLIPSTAQRFKVKDVLDPTQNIKGGLSYLRWLLSYYRGRVDLAVAAYNAGEGAVDRYGGIPPYRETRDYVKRVRRFYTAADHPYDSALAEPSRVLQVGTY